MSDEGVDSTLFVSACSARMNVCSIEVSWRESCAMSFVRLVGEDASFSLLDGADASGDPSCAGDEG
jgi:hypothetical protein